MAGRKYPYIVQKILKKLGDHSRILVKRASARNPPLPHGRDRRAPKVVR